MSEAALPMRLALVGSPNCGKTALFNQLTGGRQKVANYAGVTVERKEGRFPTPSVSAEEDEIVVLSPFCVADSSSSSFLKSNRTPRRPKRPDPSATMYGQGQATLDADQPLMSTESTSSTPSTQSTGSAPAADKPLPRPAQKPAAQPPATDEVSAAQQPVSTFSLHVSDASIKLALAALNAGRPPEPSPIPPGE